MSSCLHRWRASSHRSPLCESRACPRWLHRGPAGMSSCLHRWQASSHRYRGTTPLHPYVRVGLARDSFTAVRQACRVVCIAGKPAPTDHPYVRAGLARDGCAAVRQVCRVVCIAGKPAPTGTGEPHHSTLCGSRACPRWLHCGPAGVSSCLHRWQTSSHRYRGAAPLYPLWEPGLPAMAAPRSGRYFELSASLASQLQQIAGSRT